MTWPYANLTRLTRLVLLTVVVAGFLGLGTVEAHRDGPTYDEPVYISSALAGLTHGDLAVNAEHPPLFKVLAALPVLAADAVVSRQDPGGDGEYPYARAFVRAQRRSGRMRSVVFAARLVPLALTVLTALALYVLAAALWDGGWAGLLAALLWLAQPLVLGLGHLDGVDVPFTLTVVVFCLALLRFRRAPGLRAGAVALGASAGLAALANENGLLLCAVALVVVWLETHRGRCVALVGLCGLVTIWLPYALLGSPLAIEYLRGLLYLTHHDFGANQSYLLGTSWDGGRLWYFPLSLVVKLAPGTLILLLGAPIGWWYARRPRREAAVCVLAPAAVLFALDLVISRDIGVRYALPVVALGCALAGALVPAIAALGRRGVRRLAGAGIALVLISAVTMTAASFPDSLAWVDPVFGPPYRVATNSSVDWGQDWYALESWTAAHPGAHEDYFGPEGLSVRRPLSAPVSGWVAVSASDLNTEATLSWLRAYCPVQVIDDTLVVYRFDARPSSAPGPVEPVAPCAGGTYSHVG